MRLLLINNNPAVSRLIKLSVEKVGYEIDEFDDYGLVPLKSYDVVMVDNELYDETELSTLRENVGCEYFIYICQRGAKKPDFVNTALEKPFLPTDFLVLLEKVKNVINSTKVTEPSDKDISTLANDESLELDAFDIDDIDTFGIQEGKHSFDFSNDKDNELEDSLVLEEDKNEILDENEKELQSFDLDAEPEDELELPFINDINNVKEEDALEEENFNFEETEAHEAEKMKDEELPEESSLSILDRDDINEVKQLLDESDEDEEEAKEDEETFDFDLGVEKSENLEEKELSFADVDIFNEDEEKDKDKEIEEPLDFEEIMDERLNNEELEPQTLEETAVETQEDIIDDFTEEIEEKIEEEVTKPSIELELEKEFNLNANSAESLDDLSENLIKKAFGEEVEEEVETPSTNVHEVEVIRGEIENSIARSISGFAKSDILREALKGMKINISITFDEKN